MKNIHRVPGDLEHDIERDRRSGSVCRLPIQETLERKIEKEQWHVVKCPACGARRSEFGVKPKRNGKLEKAISGQDFYRGMAVVVAALIRDHDQPTIALDIMKCNGVKLSHFVKAKVDGFDLKHIRNACAPSQFARA